MALQAFSRGLRGVISSNVNALAATRTLHSSIISGKAAPEEVDMHTGSAHPVSSLLLAKKNAGLHLYIHDNMTVMDAVKKMASNKVGCLLVVSASTGGKWDQDAGDIVGVISERDYMTKVAVEGKKSDTTTVTEIMTPSAKIKTVTPHHNLVDAMTLMTSHNIRHLPVIENGSYLGMLSIKDVVEIVVKDAKQDIDNMSTYIAGGY